jgi:hypothetical protein
MDFAVTIEPGPGVDVWRGPAATRPPDFAKGSLIAFEPGKETIVFGRDGSECDVVFSNDYRTVGVGRKHCALIRQPTGDYKLEIFGERNVEINGAPAMTGEPIGRGSERQSGRFKGLWRGSTGGPAEGTGAKMRLGGPQGPTLSIRVIQSELAADPNATVRTGGFLSASQRMQRMRRIQAGVLAGLVVVVAAIGAYFVLNEIRIGSMEEVVAAVADDVRKEMVNQDFIDELEAAAYAVIQRDREGREVLQGTAWPVAQGMLATNAHVAALLKGSGGELIVRKPGSEPGGDGDFKVVDAVIHDGYAQFSKFDSETKAKSSSYAALGNDARRTGYDVAILKVDRTDGFGPILPRASAEEVVALDSGMPLATAGYPIGGTAEQGQAQLKPTPTVQYGRITSVTDFFMFGTDPAHAYLVQHSLPTFKGASGSPIINNEGKVVAILSGGHVVETTEGIASNAVMRNFAQRIDLILPLLGEPTDFTLDDERQRWMEVAERFNNHRNGVIEEVKTHLARKAGGGTVVEVAAIEGSLTGGGVEDNGFQRFVDRDVPIEAPGQYAFLVYGSEGAPLSLIVQRAGEAPVADGGAASFASVDAEVKEGSEVKVRVLGLSKNPSKQYMLYVYRAEPPAGAPSAALGGTGG